MAKIRKQVVETEEFKPDPDAVENDEEVLSTGQDVQQAINDVINLADDKDYAGAQTKLEEAQELMDAIEEYLDKKVENTDG